MMLMSVVGSHLMAMAYICAPFVGMADCRRNNSPCQHQG